MYTSPTTKGSTMKKLLLLTAILPLALTACSGGGSEDEGSHTDSIQAQVLAKVHEEAPSWFYKYSDAEVWKFTSQVCGGDELEDEAGFAGNISEHDRGYLLGISLSAVCKDEQ